MSKDPEEFDTEEGVDDIKQTPLDPDVTTSIQIQGLAYVEYPVDPEIEGFAGIEATQ